MNAYVFLFYFLIIDFLTIPLGAMTNSNRSSIQVFQLNCADFKPQEVDCRNDSIYLFGRRQTENVIIVMNFKGDLIRTISSTDLEVITLIDGFFKTENGFDIIAVNLFKHSVTYKILSFDNALNLLNERSLSRDIMNLEIEKSLSDGEYYYCNVTSPKDYNECQIKRLNNDQPVFSKRFKLKHLQRSPRYFIDVCHPYIVLCSDKEYKIYFYNTRTNSIMFFENPDFVNLPYTEEEIQLLSPERAMYARQFNHYPPAIYDILFINDLTLAVIRYMRPGEKKLTIDLVDVDRILLTTFSLNMEGEQFLFSFEGNGKLGVISKKSDTIYVKIIDLE